MLRSTRHRATLLALLFLPFAALSACGDSPTDTEAENVRGVWVGQAEGAIVYLEISSTAVEVYLGSHDTCFEHVEYEIVNVSGDNYTLSLPGTTFTDEIIIRRSGDRLEVSDPANPSLATFYNRSSEDTSQLEVCAGGGADPDVVCTDLPPIDVGESLTGSLSTTDPASVYGAYYDLYSLQLTTGQQVTIDLESDEIDSYLAVYDEDGGLIGENDDVDDQTFDASLTLNLNAGCYRIEATSFDPAETGSYTLSVN